jgi:hypothetical protein
LSAFASARVWWTTPSRLLIHNWFDASKEIAAAFGMLATNLTS